MCTIIAAVSVWPERPLVIAANRDEMLDRPAGDAQVWAPGEVADRRVLAPRDLRAGGTWLGINDAGLFVGITNRRAIPDPRRRSRGELVFEALGAADHRAARARIAALSARDYNPFHLLLADRSGASVIWSDGERLHELELGPGVHWITERSFGAAASERHAILERRAEELVSGTPPDVEGWRSILADHRLHDPPGGLRIDLDSVCVHAAPINYGTRSSTLIELAQPGVGQGGCGSPGVKPALRFFHARGRPCEHPLIEQPEAVAELIGPG